MSDNYIIPSRVQTKKYLMEALKSYLIAQNKSDSGWSDFFNSSVGATLLNILTGISELLFFKTDIRSLEAYSPTAKSKEAVYMLSQMVGYNPNRKKHSTGYVRASVRPYANANFVIPKGFLLTDGPHPLVISQNYNVSIQDTFILDIEVKQGKWKEVYLAFDEALIADYYTPGLYDYTKMTIEGNNWEFILIEEEDFKIDQFEVYIDVNGVPARVIDKVNMFKFDDSEIEILNTLSDADKSKYVKSKTAIALDENFIVLTDPNSVLVRTDYKGGVLLLFGDNYFGLGITKHDVIRLRYLYTEGASGVIEKGVNVGNYIISGHDVNFVTTTIIQGGSDEDDVEKVKYLTSRFFTTQGRAVTAFDTENLAMSYPGVISAKCKRIEGKCCTVCVSALKTQGIDWNESEKKEFLNYLALFKMESLYIEFWDPIDFELDLEIYVVLKGSTDFINLENKIKEFITTKYCYKLAASFISTEVVDALYDDIDPNIIRAYVKKVNGNEKYPDINLECDSYFKISSLTVSYSIS